MRPSLVHAFGVTLCLSSPAALVAQAHARSTPIMEAGAWTRLRIEVVGVQAKLFVNEAPQPALVVNDLKLGKSRGRIALWARISSDAYFSRLRVVRRQP